VIDDDPRVGSFKNRKHVRHLVGLDLEIDEHAQVRQFGQQPGGLRVILHSQLRRVEGYAAYPQGTEPFELTARHVVGYDRHAPEPALPAGQDVDEAAVVVVITRVRLDD